MKKPKLLGSLFQSSSTSEPKTLSSAGAGRNRKRKRDLLREELRLDTTYDRRRRELIFLITFVFLVQFIFLRGGGG